MTPITVKDALEDVRAQLTHFSGTLFDTMAPEIRELTNDRDSMAVTVRLNILSRQIMDTMAAVEWREAELEAEKQRRDTAIARRGANRRAELLRLGGFRPDDGGCWCDPSTGDTCPNH